MTFLALDNEVPSLTVSGLRIFASRDGDRVTGRVEFPYSVYGRSAMSIDYHSRRPDPIDNRQSPIDNASLPHDHKARKRLDLVHQWRDLCALQPDVSKVEHARTIAANASIKCSVRSLQLWSRRLDSLGPEGLIDGYIPAPRKVLALDGKIAADAVLVCAWWSFRIGNSDSIDTKMMHAAAGVLERLQVADVLATIDCYFAWPADRRRFPFKAFSKWVRYDFEKWLFRAADLNDYRRVTAEMRGGNLPPPPGVDRPVPLLDPPDGSHAASLRSSVAGSLSRCPDAKARRRDAADRSTRQSIRALASPLGKGGSQGGIAFALAGLDDNYRVMLLRAAAGDADARRQAVSTMPVWWPLLPDDVRIDLERCTDIPLSVRKPGDEQRMIRSRVMLLLPRLKREQGAGFDKLNVAAALI